MSLSSQLKQTFGDIVNLRNSSTQFLQGGGRWFPFPQGNDAELANGLRDLQDRVATFKKDLDSGESMDTLKYDMRQMNASYDAVDGTLPKVGGNRETAKDWGIVQNDVAGDRQTFAAMVDNQSGVKDENGEQTPTVPDLAQRLTLQVQAFKQSLGAFLRWPDRVPPPREEDLQLVQTLKGFEQQLGKFVQEEQNGRPVTYLQESEKQLRYMARKMDPLVEAIGPDDQTGSQWQHLRDTVEQMHTTIGNNPEGSDMQYLEAVPSNTPSQAPPGTGPQSSGQTWGAPVPQGNAPGF
jgi:hypothetical protein